MNLLGKSTDKVLETYPYVLLTDPLNGIYLCKITHIHTLMEILFGSQTPQIVKKMIPNLMTLVTSRGELCRICLPFSDTSTLTIHKHVTKPPPIDLNYLCPYFGWVDKDIIKKSYNLTIIWGVPSTRLPMWTHLKSQVPAFNIP